jgi:hypothetical protein
MDLATTIIAAIVLALCLVPLVLAQNKNKNKKKVLLQTLTNYAAAKKRALTKHDLWHDTAIGLDENSNRLFFLKINNDEKHLQEVHLAEISACSTTGEDNPEVAEKLELVLHPAGKTEAGKVLEFYNSATAMQINSELQLIKKWKGIIDARINSQN